MYIPDSKVHGANMGPTWVLSAPDGPHVGPMNLAIRDGLQIIHHFVRAWLTNYIPNKPLDDFVYLQVGCNLRTRWRVYHRWQKNIRSTWCFGLKTNLKWRLDMETPSVYFN